MAIEIREVVIKATVNKTLDGQDHYLTKTEFAKLQERMQEKIMKKVKIALDEARSSR
jgi:uncharacterized protein (UPF0216 family)